MLKSNTSQSSELQLQSRIRDKTFDVIYILQTLLLIDAQ